MNYKITNDFNKATHWIPTENNNNLISANITVDIPYKIIKSDEDDDEYIIDDDGTQSPIHMILKGEFVIELID